MSVESEISDLREDFRSMRAKIDSFFATFQGDVMTRLGALEQWQVLANEERSKVSVLEAKVAGALLRSADLERTQGEVRVQATEIKALTSVNDQMQGSFRTLRNIGGLAIGVLTVAEIIHGFFTIRGH